MLALQATFEAALDSAAGGKGSFSAHAQGRWQKQPMRASLKADSPLPLVAADSTETVAVNVQLDAGRSALRFDGRIADLLSHQRLDGRFSLRGPSLADVGQAVRITLPSTPAFDLQGRIEHATQGPPRVWNVEITRGLIGSSDLAGSLSFDARGIDPAGRGRLSGALHSRTLWLPDLGPAIGARAPGQPAPPQQPADRILPQSTFDLPALRAMDADVKLAVQSLRLDRPPSADKAASDAPAVKPIEPLSLRIQLDDGVLRLADIVAGLAQGRIEGEMVLDAKEANAPAKWQARLNARNVRIEQFVPAVGQRAVPWASGRLTARVSLDGRGRSTAELLASADGSITLLWSGGTVSHLAIEAMGLDIAQGLGRLLRGDESLPVICGAAYLRVKNGRAEPSPAVIDTRDSTVWLDGSATLADERLDLRATVSPKDRSWLSLRSPLVLRGSFIKPEPGVQSGQIAKRLLPGVLLALINPLAGLLPLVDTGDREAAQQAAAACTRLTVGSYGKPAPAPTVLR